MVRYLCCRGDTSFLKVMCPPTAGMAVSASWAGNFIVVGTFLSVAEWLTPAGAFFIYGVCCSFFTIFFYFALPETRGLSLNEIQDIYEVYGTPGAPTPRELHAWVISRRNDHHPHHHAEGGAVLGGSAGDGVRERSSSGDNKNGGGGRGGGGGD